MNTLITINECMLLFFSVKIDEQTTGYLSCSIFCVGIIFFISKLRELLKLCFFKSDINSIFKTTVQN